MWCPHKERRPETKLILYQNNYTCFRYLSSKRSSESVQHVSYPSTLSSPDIPQKCRFLCFRSCVIIPDRGAGSHRVLKIEMVKNREE